MTKRDILSWDYVITEKESKGSLQPIFILVEQVRNKLDIYPQAQK